MSKVTPDSGGPAAPRKKPVTPAGFVGAAGPGYTASQVADPNSQTVKDALAASVAANPHAAGTDGTPFAGAKFDPGSGLPDPYDVSTDPVIARTHAVTAVQRENANSAAIAARKQLAIALGDASGIIDDPTAVAEAKNNPFSTLAQLLHGYDATTHQHGEDLNKANLWYSGAHAKQLGEDAYNYQGQVAGARGDANSRLGGITSDLASALSGADSADIGALNDATNRASTRAATYGYDPGATTNNAVTNTDTHPAAPGATTNGNTTTVVSNGGASPLATSVGSPVGTSANAKISALLGRKLDPRFDY